MTRHVEKIKQGQEVWVSGVEKFTLLNRVVRENLTKKVTRSDIFHSPYFSLFKILVFHTKRFYYFILKHKYFNYFIYFIILS